MYVFFFFQAEDGIRDIGVTGVQTCALPILSSGQELDASLSTHVIPDDTHNTQELARVRISGPAFYLLRPDGHVGLAGTRLEPDAITRYLAESCVRTVRALTPISDYASSPAITRRCCTTLRPSAPTA